MPNRWCNNIIGDYAVVTGCDSNQEWMLGWWYKNYSKTNNFPVVFADFGMSEDKQRWCNNVGTVIKVGAPFKNWFKKPFAMLGTPYKHMIWVDIDCEVRKNLGPLFECSKNSIGVTKDPHTPFCKQYVNKDETVATGVVVATHGHCVIEKWADAVEALHNGIRGDQEAFNSILREVKHDVIIMPPEYQWLRIDGNNDNAVIMHWTGNKGKKIIKQQIGGNSVNLKVAPTVVKPKTQVKRQIITRDLNRRKTISVLKTHQPQRIINPPQQIPIDKMETKATIKRKRYYK